MSITGARMAFLHAAATILSGLPSAPTVEVGEDRLFSDVGTYPWVGLLPAPGTLIERDVHGAGDTLSFHVLLYGYVQGDGTTSRTALLMTLIEEAQIALRQALEPGGALQQLRPGTAFTYADFIDYEAEDLAYHREGTGAEFVVPLLVRIPDALNT
jgi:hypothetical protein